MEGKRSAGQLGLASDKCICNPMDLAALGHMTNCPCYREKDAPDTVKDNGISTGPKDVLVRALHDLCRASENVHRAILSHEMGDMEGMRGKLSLAIHDIGNADKTLSATRATLPSPRRTTTRMPPV